MPSGVVAGYIHEGKLIELSDARVQCAKCNDTFQRDGSHNHVRKCYGVSPVHPHRPREPRTKTGVGDLVTDGEVCEVGEKVQCLLCTRIFTPGGIRLHLNACRINDLVADGKVIRVHGVCSQCQCVDCAVCVQCGDCFAHVDIRLHSAACWKPDQPHALILGPAVPE